MNTAFFNEFLKNVFNCVVVHEWSWKGYGLRSVDIQCKICINTDNQTGEKTFSQH